MAHKDHNCFNLGKLRSVQKTNSSCCDLVNEIASFLPNAIPAVLAWAVPVIHSTSCRSTHAHAKALDSEIVPSFLLDSHCACVDGLPYVPPVNLIPKVCYHYGKSFWVTLLETASPSIFDWKKKRFFIIISAYNITPLVHSPNLLKRNVLVK